MISNCCGAYMNEIFQDVEICPDCKEHTSFEEECILSPLCKCDDCQEQNEPNLRGETYS
jgi:hypothetical protein